MRKIAILYPKGDNFAKEIALKLLLNLDWVYVVNQSFSKPEIIYERLKRVKSAFFIWLNPKTKIDKNTKKYLEFLIKNNKKIFAILLEDFIFPYEAEKIEKYNPDDIEGTFQKIYSIIGELIKEPQQNKNTILRAYIPILLISPKLKNFSRKNYKKFSKNFKKPKIKTGYQNQRHKYW